VERSRYVVKEWRNASDYEGIAHGFADISMAIDKAEALGKLNFDGYDESGKWYPVQRAQDGTWSRCLTVAEDLALEEAAGHAIQTRNMATRADGRSIEAMGQIGPASAGAAMEQENTSQVARDALTPREKAVLEQSRAMLDGKALGAQFTAEALRELEVRLRSNRAPAGRMQAAPIRNSEHQFNADVQRNGRER
jgi:hypothetical protein